MAQGFRDGLEIKDGEDVGLIRETLMATSENHGNIVPMTTKMMELTVVLHPSLLLRALKTDNWKSVFFFIWYLFSWKENTIKF